MNAYRLIIAGFIAHFVLLSATAFAGRYVEIEIGVTGAVNGWVYANDGSSIYGCNDKYEPSFRPGAIYIENNGTHSLYFSSAYTGDYNLEIPPKKWTARGLGQQRVHPLPKRSGSDAIPCTIKVWIESGAQLPHLPAIGKPWDRNAPAQNPPGSSAQITNAMNRNASLERGLEAARQAKEDAWREWKDAEYTKGAVLSDYTSGFFCSQCGRSKTEFTRNGESFETHLREVNGYPVPATLEQRQKKETELNRMVEQAEERYHAAEAAYKRMLADYNSQRPPAQDDLNRALDEKAQQFRRGGNRSRY